MGCFYVECLREDGALCILQDHNLEEKHPHQILTKLIHFIMMRPMPTEEGAEIEAPSLQDEQQNPNQEAVVTTPTKAAPPQVPGNWFRY